MVEHERKAGKLNLEAHELADLLPFMAEAEYQALKSDIQDVGLAEPIVLFEGKILDGRNRYRACKELGIDPKTRLFEGTGEDALNYVVSANLHRRQLKPSQRAALGVKLLPLVQEEVHKSRSEKLRKAAKRRTEKALWEDTPDQLRANLPTGEARSQIRVRKIVADMLGIADRLIGDAQFLSTKSPAQLKQVEQGTLRLHAAVAPYRDKTKKRGRRAGSPLKKAIRLLRQAAAALANEYAELAKQVQAVAVKVQKEKPAVTPTTRKKAAKGTKGKK